MRGKESVGGFVRQIVANMREKSSLGLQPFYDSQRIIDGGMRRVRPMPQRIQKKNVQVLQSGE